MVILVRIQNILGLLLVSKFTYKIATPAMAILDFILDPIISRNGLFDSIIDIQLNLKHF